MLKWVDLFLHNYIYIFFNFNFKFHHDVNFSKKIEIILMPLICVAAATQQSSDSETMTTAIHAIHTNAVQNNYAVGRLPIAKADGRRAFYDVTDALQETGNRGRAFDTIVLEMSAETGDFNRYIVFRQHVPTPQPTLPMATSISSAAAAAALYAVTHRASHAPDSDVVPEVVPERLRVDATIILYDADTDRLYSDGAYYKHTFCPSADGFVSISDEHIANEKFKFYKQRV
jgi:hypothetical protein